MLTEKKYYPGKAHILEQFPFSKHILMKTGEDTGIEDEPHDIKYCRYDFTCSYILVEWITEKEYTQCMENFKRLENIESFLDYILDNKLESFYANVLCP